jgi:tripartite-type tricarboxylate transporter receptor subunit TctC
MMMRAFIYLALLGSVIVPGSAPATAQDWPTRTVKVVAPVGPGGVTDTLARLTADRLAKMFGKPFVVENRAGGGGAIGTEYAARAPNDGYSFYFGGGAQFIITPLIKKLTYDPIKDLTPISMVSLNGMGLVVAPDLPVHSLAEFIAYVKSNPGKVNFGVSGIGQSSHLAPAVMAAREKLDMVMVPYQTVPQAMVGLLSGVIHMYFGNISDVIEFVRTNKVRLLGISTERRTAQFPDTPTISETIPNFVFTSWIGYFAPTGTPRSIIDQVSRAVAEICHDQEIVKLLKNMGIDSIGNTPDEFTAVIQHDMPIARSAVEAAGLLPK